MRCQDPVLLPVSLLPARCQDLVRHQAHSLVLLVRRQLSLRPRLPLKRRLLLKQRLRNEVVLLRPRFPSRARRWQCSR